MTMPQLRKILASVALCLAAAGLSSCSGPQAIAAESSESSQSESATSVEIYVYPSGEIKQLKGEAVETIRRELRDLYTSSTERILNESSMPTLSAEGAIIGHAQYDSPLVDIEDGEQSWTIARGLRESEALLLSYGTAPYRVPNQKKMLRLLNHIGLEN